MLKHFYLFMFVRNAIANQLAGVYTYDFTPREAQVLQQQQDVQYRIGSSLPFTFGVW